MSTAVALLPEAATRLSERLRSQPDVAAAFAAARRRFLAHGRLEMAPLAAELGIDRTSLFRRIGNRDELLTEVLWSLADPTLAQAATTARPAGADRVLDVLVGFVDAMLASQPFRAFVGRDPARALRLLTAPDSPVHLRFVAATEALLAPELASGRMRSPLPGHELAYLLVRLTESFVASDLAAGTPPDPSRAAAAIRMVLASTRV